MTRPVAASAGTVTSWAARTAAIVVVTLAAIRGERALMVRSMRDWLAVRSAVSVGYFTSRSRIPGWPSRLPTARSRAGEMLVRA